MIPPVGNKPIFPTLTTLAESRLKSVSSIDSFTFGKQNLRPAIVELFKRQGIEIKDIYLDNPARVRLMGMMPSFESLVAEGKTAEEIFSKLELSLFSSDSETKSQTLYVLGDANNIRSINNPSELSLEEAIQILNETAEQTQTPPASPLAEKIAALKSKLQEKVTSQFIVVPQGQLPTLSGIRSLKKTEPSLNGSVSFYVKEYFGVNMTDLLTDSVGKEYLVTERPSFKNDLQDSSGNLGVRGHLIIFEMENENDAKLYLLRNQDNLLRFSTDVKNNSALWEAVQSITDFRPLFNKIFQAGPYTIEITNPNPQGFTFIIKDVVDRVRRESSKSAAYVTMFSASEMPPSSITCKIQKEGLVLELPEIGKISYPFSKENINLSWVKVIKEGSFDNNNPGAWENYKVENLNLRQITEALLKVIEETQKGK